MDFFLSVIDFFPVCHGLHRAVVSNELVIVAQNKARQWDTLQILYRWKWEFE